MKSFAGDSYLINNVAGMRLYDEYAKNMPIFDYHNHLSPQEIFENKKFINITELWLGHDHYKWRAMRAAGVDEYFITGDAPPKEKFHKFAQVTQRLIGSPLYYWVHMELSHYFGITEPLTERNADEIYERCSEMLRQPEMSARALIERCRVKVLCTTDDPTSDLGWHKALAEQDVSFSMFPTFRADRVLNIASGDFETFILQLSKSESMEIKDIDELCAALASSLRRFKEAGCFVSDHGLAGINYVDCEKDDADKILKERLAGRLPECIDAARFQSYMLLKLARMYFENDIVMQMHLGAVRNINSTMFRQIGPDSGYDIIGNSLDVDSIIRLLDVLNSDGVLPKTIIYPINPVDFTKLAVAVVAFNCGKAPYYVQFGNAWWFNDTVRGIRNQLTDLMETGGLSGFVGMLTDSRSLTSFTRHDFFRRILCDLLGEYVEKGDYPPDFETLGALVQDVCYNNAVSFFGVKL